MKHPPTMCTLALAAALFFAAGCLPRPVPQENPPQTDETPLAEAIPAITQTVPADQPTTVPADDGPPAPWLVIDAESLPKMLVVDQMEIPYAYNLAWNPESTLLAAHSFRGAGLYAINPEPQEGQRMTLVADLRPEEPLAVLDVSLATGLAVLSEDQQGVELRPLLGEGKAVTFKVEAPFTSAALSPDGATLALTSVEAFEVGLWNVGTGQLEQTLTGFETAAPIYSASFAGPSRVQWLARGTIQLQDIPDGHLYEPLHHEDFVTASAPSPDGRWLASAAGGTWQDTYGGLVTIWEIESGEPNTVLPSGEWSASGLSFSPDGSLLAAALADGLYFWDLSDPETPTILPADGRPFLGLAFAPDGRSLAAVQDGGLLTLWQVGGE